MRKLIFVLMFPISTNAQSPFFISVDASCSNTWLLNKHDRSADSRLDYVMSFAPEAGLNLGYRFGGSNLQTAITIGIKYSRASQRYKGHNSDYIKSGVKDLEAKTSLAYLKVPLMLHLSFGKDRRLLPYLSVGGYYGRLLNYRDKMEGRSIYVVNGQDYPIQYLFEGLSYTINTITVGYQSGNLDQTHYSGHVWGTEFAAGVQSKISESASFTAGLKASYSLTDIENKENTKSFNPWEYMSPKYYSDDAFNTKVQTNRPATHLLGLGLELGFRYSL